MEHKKEIALLGDDLKLAETLQLSLEEEGYQVIHLVGLKEELQLIRDENVNMLIVDLDVPIWRMGFLKEAKKMNPMLPIVLLSSLEENLAKFLFNEIEVAKTFVKPFDLYELSDSIKSTLGSG
jgi:DNA-binding response OmpR family regulator